MPSIERKTTVSLSEATAALAIQASAMGLQVHQMAGILADKAREIFGIPEGYDAVEPDNMDGTENSTGFTISTAQQNAYDEWVAQDVHSLGMAVFQKNYTDQSKTLQPDNVADNAQTVEAVAYKATMVHPAQRPPTAGPELAPTMAAPPIDPSVGALPSIVRWPIRFASDMHKTSFSFDDYIVARCLGIRSSLTIACPSIQQLGQRDR